MPQEELNAVVTQRLEVTPDLVILRVVPDGWELPAFEAGQFGVIGLPPDAPAQSIQTLSKITRSRTEA